MTGIRDLLEATWEVGPPVYATNGSLLGYKILENHPLEGSWISVQAQQIVTFEQAGGETVLDDNPIFADMPAPMAENFVQNAAVIYATVDGSGVATAKGTGTNRSLPTCLYDIDAQSFFGGTILFVSGGSNGRGALFTLAGGSDETGWGPVLYPAVWDGRNSLTFMLMGNISDKYANIETSLYVRCDFDMNAVDSWLRGFKCA